ncbi:dTDP-4-dehydrorhamnose 3,5-epimerase family protein [Rhizobium sp. NPDC090279]
MPDVKIIEPGVFADDRGFFFESFSKVKFEQAIGRGADFVFVNYLRVCD